MDISKNNILFNKNKYQLKAKLSTYIIQNIKFLKNGYILIYFPKENTISSFKFEKLDSEEQEKITKSSEFNFYNKRTFKKEISFTENDSIFSVKELINGNLIFFFNEYFKIYNIFKKFSRNSKN